MKEAKVLIDAQSKGKKARQDLFRPCFVWLRRTTWSEMP